MSSIERIDRLIEAGFKIVETDFDAAAVQDWREKALDYLSAELGPEHPYTRRFQRYVGPERRAVLAGGGVLVAARETSLPNLVAAGRASC
jgi:hypothetical protein